MPMAGDGAGRTVEWLGARIDVGDLDGVLAGAGPEEVGLLHGSGHPPPVLGIDLTASPAGDDGALVLRGTVRLAGPRSPARALSRELAAAAVPVAAALLLGPIRAPLAALTVGAAAVRARQAAQQAPPAGPVPAPAPAAAFAGEVALDQRVTANGTRRTVTAAAEVARPTADDVVAFARVLLDVARQAAGAPADDAFFAGRTYSLGPPPEPAPAAPAGLDTLGGLDEVVDQLREVATSFQHPEVMRRWGARRPRGILLYGPPGTGKTTLARALAAEVGATVREIRVPDVLSQWVGASERNLQKVFAQARRARRPTLLLFDEFESIISYTGQPYDAASQMNNALAGLFKQEMSTLVDANPNLLVVATTNFPERVDESLVRAGRFDLKLEVPLPDAAARADILRTLLRLLAAEDGSAGFRLLADDVDVDELARLTPGRSGADLDELLRRVRMAKALDEARGAGTGPITQADLRAAAARMRDTV